MANFVNSGKLWTKNEDEQLDKLYNKDGLNIIEISEIHSRSPNGIACRLVKNNYIIDKTLARGYTEYITSDLHKNILEENKKSRERSREKKSENEKIKMINNYHQQVTNKLYSEIYSLKHEIVELKNVIKELTDVLIE